MKLKELGEKRIIEQIILPLFNPQNKRELSGDDCAVINNKKSEKICVSTDRVPSDLIAFKIGLIDYFNLGYYLAILNISDAAAAGSVPNSLLLNFAFPGDFQINDLKSILTGVKKACDLHKVQIVGGDLSDSKEMSLSATIIGFSKKPLFRKGIKKNDLIFCCDNIGLTPTAFKYFLHAKPKGLQLSKGEESILIKQFSLPKARIELGQKLAINKQKVCCMDNTDGLGQTLKELSEINSLSIFLEAEKLPIHSISKKVANFLDIDPISLALEPGADFQLIGAIGKNITESELKKLGLKIIGFTKSGTGINLIKENITKSIEIKGWNYYL